MGVSLFNGETNEFLGSIDDADLKFLKDQLEEESISDNDYFIDANIIELLEEAGTSQFLISILKSAVRESEGIDYRCSHQQFVAGRLAIRPSNTEGAQRGVESRF